MIVWHYYDIKDGTFYDPWQGCRQVFSFDVTKGDTVESRLAVTWGKATVAAATGIPTSAFRFPLTDYADDIITAFKTSEQRADEDDLTLAGSGFYSASTWHTIGYGCISTRYVWPLATTGGLFCFEYALLKSSAVTMRLPSGVIPLWAEVPVPVYVGDEASAPTSTTGALYSGTVTAGTNTATITVAGMTATGTVVPILYNAPFSTTIRATCQSGSVLVTLGGVAPSNTTVKVKVESLA
jgi:hypothetical protein